MMVDASALVAILLDEPEAREFEVTLERVSRTLTHPVSVYETVLAVARDSRRTLDEAQSDVEGLLDELEVRVVSIGKLEARAALDAFSRYGKGSGHPARLNMGDCFSYAVAKLRGMPLLYKGDDFAQTDLA
jgi:ribonuclease VapC